MLDRSSILAAALAASLVVAGSAVAQTPLGKSITFQGRLSSNGAPADGPLSMTFKLYDSAEASVPLSTVSLPSVAVTDGVFSVELDFGGGRFDGSARWIGMTVAAEPEMAPRQELTATPYALHALSAASIVDGSITDADVGVTAAISGSKLADNSVTHSKIVDGPYSGLSADFFDGYDSNLFARLTGTGAMTLADRLTVSGGGASITGSVAIFGNTSTTGNVNVLGDLRTGTLSSMKPVATGEEKLRIVRGTVKFDGTVLEGSGFTVAWSDGLYTITFSTPFSDTPSVTATAGYLLWLPFGDPHRKMAVASIPLEYVTPSSVKLWVHYQDFSDDIVYGRSDFQFQAIGPR